jgi:hypothetical protein
VDKTIKRVLKVEKRKIKAPGKLGDPTTLNPKPLTLKPEKQKIKAPGKITLNKTLNPKP